MSSNLLRIEFSCYDKPTLPLYAMADEVASGIFDVNKRGRAP